MNQSQKTGKMIYKKEMKVRCEGKMWECIVADEEVAVFGEIEKFDPSIKKTTVSWENIFAISNKKAGCQMETFVGWCELTGKPIFEGDNYAFDDEDGRMVLR